MKKTIGYIQIILGILLIISSLIAVIYLKDFILNKSQDIEENIKLTMETQEIPTSINTTSGQIYFNTMIIRTGIGLSTIILLISLEVIVLILSIMIILQGIVNIQNGNNKIFRKK